MKPFPRPTDVYEDGDYQEVRDRAIEKLLYHGEFIESIKLYDSSEAEKLHEIYSIICEEARAQGWQAECSQKSERGEIPYIRNDYGVLSAPAIAHIGIMTTVSISITNPS
jgi:hypothetical protein